MEFLQGSKHQQRLYLLLLFIIGLIVLLWTVNLIQGLTLSGPVISLAITCVVIIGLIIFLFRQNRMLEEQQASFEASVNNINLGFIITDTKGEMISINNAAKRLLLADGGTASPAILRNNQSHKLKSQKNAELKDIASRLKGTFDLGFELKKCLMERKSISVENIPFQGLFLHIFMTPIVVLKDNDLGLDLIGAVILVEDKTNQKKTEHSKDQLFWLVAQELQTPLGTIQGSANNIKRSLESKMPDKALLGMVDDIYLQAASVNMTIQDFLDISQLEQGQITFQKQNFDLGQLIEQSISEMSNLALAKNLQLIYQKPSLPIPAVLADMEKTKQVIVNLISNGIKYTDQGGVKVELKNDGQMAQVSVFDTGKGISAADQKTLFKKLELVASPLNPNNLIKRNGLGLYLCKLLIKGMGGEIKLENSQLNKGSVFSFTLPYSAKS